jgi:hypothetical protein
VGGPESRRWLSCWLLGGKRTQGQAGQHIGQAWEARVRESASGRNRCPFPCSLLSAFLGEHAGTSFLAHSSYKLPASIAALANLALRINTIALSSYEPYGPALSGRLKAYPAPWPVTGARALAGHQQAGTHCSRSAPRTYVFPRLTQRLVLVCMHSWLSLSARSFILASYGYQYISHPPDHC